MSGRSAFGRFLDELDVFVFVVGAGVAALAVLAFALFEGAATEAMTGVNTFLWTNLGWAYLLVMFVLVAFVLFLIFGPWGNIKLGSEDEEPEFTFLAYFAMLYSAGIAAGIVFWGLRRRSSTTTPSRPSSAPSPSRPPPRSAPSSTPSFTGGSRPGPPTS